MLLGERGEAGELAVALSGDTLTADLTLTQDGSYRFWLEPPFGRPIREERSHRLTAEPDAPPRVEILGPADRLELATPRPIEIGYSASDDFGLGAIELVYRIGDRPEQRVPLRDGAGGRARSGADGLGSSHHRPRRAPSGSPTGSRRTIAIRSPDRRSARRGRCTW